MLEELKETASANRLEAPSEVTDWLKSQMARFSQGPDLTSEEATRDRQEKLQKDKEIRDLQLQQEQISRKLEALQGTSTTVNGKSPMGENPSCNQEILMQQLRTALSGKKEDDPNKLLLKALVTSQNKVDVEGGTNTLKPSILQGLFQPKGGPTMAEWLANLNRQEEGESELSKLLIEGEGDGRLGKVKSGILDRATTNIQQKQVWPQQSLGEDWADKDIEFKQIKFEHLVAGETRTIETCMDPAQILGRLRLLHRIAYLKLRGYERHLLRKMYAAILTSIETKEYSWESNFDRFENHPLQKSLGRQ